MIEVRTAVPTHVPMPDDGEDADLKAALSTLIDAAISLNDNGVDNALKAQDYYDGEKFGNEEPGRSQLVVPEVRNTVDGLIPQLLRVIFGQDTPLEFIGHNASQQAAAKQATRYVRAFIEQRGGFLTIMDLLKDGLIKRLGAVKVSIDETVHHSEEEFTGLTLPDIELLAQDADLSNMVAEPEGAGVHDPMQPLQQTFRVRALRTDRRPRLCIDPLPREEFLRSEDAKSTEDASYLGHRRDLTVGELIAMGYDAEMIESYASDAAPLSQSPEAQRRLPSGVSSMGSAPAGSKNRTVEYIESWAKLEAIPEGGSEPIYGRWLICSLGRGRYILSKRLSEDHPFAAFTPYPTPHAIEGRSVFDNIGNLQLAKSVGARGILDSLALSLYGRAAFNEKKVSLEDIMNTAVGAPIRVDGIPSENLMQFRHEFVGQYGLPLVQWFDELIERATGMAKGAGAIDINALQSTEKDAAKSAVSITQAQVEMLARLLAETCLKPLFQKILKLLVQHPDLAVPIYKGGNWTTADPRAWSPLWEMTVNVGTGSSKQEQLAAMLGLKATMEAVLTQYGPQNPVCTVAQYVQLLRDINELAGIHTSDSYLNTDEQVQQTLQAMAAQPKQPSPEMILAQAELLKAQHAAEAKQAEIELDAAVKEREAEHERQVLAQKAQQEEAKAANDLQIAREKIAADIMMAREKIAADLERTQIELAVKVESDAANRDFEAANANADREVKVADSQARRSEKAAPAINLSDGISGAIAETVASAVAPLAQGMTQALGEMSQIAKQLGALAERVSQPVIMPAPKDEKPRQKRNYELTRPDGTKTTFRELD